MNVSNIKKTVTDYRELKRSLFYPFEINESDSDFFIEQKEKSKSKFISVKNKLKKTPNKADLISHFRDNLEDSIDYILGYLRKSRAGYSLDRNQGLNIENFIFGKIINAIQDAISIGVSYPQFYYSPDSDFDENNLRKLLEEFKSGLRQREFNDYFELEDFTDKYIEQIKSMWKEENKKLISK
jgi:hypothetical protein